MDQLDEVTNESHNSKPDSDSLGNLNKFCKGCELCIRKLCLSEWTFVGRLGTPGKELKTKVSRCESRRLDSACLIALTDELLGNVDELLELVGAADLLCEERELHDVEEVVVELVRFVEVLLLHLVAHLAVFAVRTCAATVRCGKGAGTRKYKPFLGKRS